MASIRRLDSSLVSQIAAGEVVERPASALKELLENSLDAGATRCDVEVEGGGITRLAVRDDGHGMLEADALLALERHTTSKIQSFDDLVNVGTYGFRGEALPSIASVSRMLLCTRARGEEAGVEIRVDGGATPIVRQVGTPSGTLIELRDLFFNVPARRKFLRASATEAGHAGDVVENAALSAPGVTFTFTRDGRMTRQWLRAKDREERVRNLLSGETLARVVGERGPLRLEAYLSRPERSTSGAGELRLLINDRSIKDRALAMAIAQAYGSVLERGRYPRGVVYLDMPGELVDVNVHPQKSEVRFANHRAVCDAIFGLVAHELSHAFSLPAGGARFTAPRAPAPVNDEPLPITAPSPKIPEIRSEIKIARADFEAPMRLFDSAQPRLPKSESVRTAESPVYEPLLETEARTKGDWNSLRFVAQLRQTYLVCEGRDGLYIVDQHAAAERVTFDRLRRQYRARSITMQRLLFPQLIDVTPDQFAFAAEHPEEFLSFGLEVETRGERQLSIHAVPKLLLRAAPERLLHALLNEELRQGERAFSDAVDLRLATMACHGSIRAGDSMTTEEATALLAALDQVDFAGHCPHGRPVLTALTYNELERKVGRR
jgi:DNA mismatch repair protein MutL